MPVTDLPADQFLRRDYMDRFIAERVNGQLIWNDIFPKTTITAKSVSWLRDPYS